MYPFDEEENCQGLVETRRRLKARKKDFFILRMSILRADDVEECLENANLMDRLMKKKTAKDYWWKQGGKRKLKVSYCYDSNCNYF
jgi:hypothetical protein